MSKELWIWEDPIEGEEYVMAIDVSSGFSDDNSTINILKLNQITTEKIINNNGKPKK